VHDGELLAILRLLLQVAAYCQKEGRKGIPPTILELLSYSIIFYSILLKQQPTDIFTTIACLDNKVLW
jgi:hypothetical protein